MPRGQVVGAPAKVLQDQAVHEGLQDLHVELPWQFPQGDEVVLLWQMNLFQEIHKIMQNVMVVVKT